MFIYKGRYSGSGGNGVCLAVHHHSCLVFINYNIQGYFYKFLVSKFTWTIVEGDHHHLVLIKIEIFFLLNFIILEQLSNVHCPNVSLKHTYSKENYARISLSKLH